MPKIINLDLQDGENIAFFGDLHMDAHTPASRIDILPETACKKLSNMRESCIAYNVKVVIFLGDVFHRVMMPNEAINMVGAELLKYREAGIELYSIIGNHDISRNNLDQFIKSPLAVLFTFGVLKHIDLENRIVINKKTLITPVDYLQYPIKAHAKAKHNILVAHMFYEDKGSGEEHNITEEDLRKWGYDAIVLGHDHRQYPIIRECGTDIIRSGSILRATSHQYNFEQQPAFYVLRKPWDYDVANFVKVDISCKPFTEVLSTVVVNKKTNLADLGDLMSDLVDQLTASATPVGGDFILEKIKNETLIDESVRNIILRYLSDCGVVV